MSVTSGFFNSLNGDRKYNAEQMSSIFDGIIRDGVFASIGNVFQVKAAAGSRVTIDTGKAWFNHAWVYNDALISLAVSQSELILDRYDAVVIEVDHSDAVRAGSIKVIKGTPSSTPQYPTMANSEFVHQYPLAYVYVTAGATEVTQDKITNMVGTSSCPYITGILEVHNIDNIVAQWEAQWEKWSSQWEDWGYQWDQWYNNETTTAENDISNWMTNMKSDFDSWFADLQTILDDDVAAQLALRILELEERFSTLARDKVVVEDLEDDTGDAIDDSNGNPIEGSTVFVAGEAAPGTDEESVVVETELQASKWTGDEAPYQYELVLKGVTMISIQDIIPPLGVTTEQLEALQGANIQDGGQAADLITLLAFGDKPEIDIPIRVVMRGD